MKSLIESKKKFIVPGQPKGFVTVNWKARNFDERYAKYAQYKAEVQKAARLAGIELPLVATKDRPIIIKTIAYFQNGVHSDPGNVNKGVCDALFYESEKRNAGFNRKTGKKTRSGKGNDKYTGGSFPPPLYDKENPRVVVIICYCKEQR